MRQVKQHAWRIDLWTYAVRLYEFPRIKDRCLYLQNKHGLNVDLLLWSAWLEHENQVLTQEMFDGATTAIQIYSENYLEPLRKMRADSSSLTQALTTLDDEFKKLILQAELCVERRVIHVLQNYSEMQTSLNNEVIRGQNLAVCLAQYCAAPTLEIVKAEFLVAMREM